MNKSDLKIELYPTTTAGGQQVSIVRAGVKVTHVPTGLVAICEYERSQLRNKNVAVGMIEYGLVTINYNE